MKKVVILVIFMVFAVGSVVMADPGSQLQLTWGSQVSPAQCDHSGGLVVNTTGKIINDADSGQGGNYWAFDNFARHIQVWAQSDGSYCVLVTTVGSFDGQAGQTSPGAGGTLSGNEDGSIDGGYSAVVQGTLKSDPAWSTKGNIENLDYQCDISGNCPGYVNWLDQYFESGYSFSYTWWGWIYRAGKQGTWVNSSDGNSGDILSS